MEIEVDHHDGSPGTFVCERTFTSAWVAKEILVGKTYPILPFLDEVRSVWDVGANVGAASVLFARTYPEATVHAFEPAPSTLEVLETNAASHPKIRVHHYGLYDKTAEIDLHVGEESILSSVQLRSVSTTETVRAQIRSADEVATELGDEPIDLLKLDVEGSEVQVLESLGSARLAQVQVLYVEYDNRLARRRIEDLVRDSHDLFYASMLALDQGEMVYVASHLVDRPGANDALIEILRPQFS